MNDFQRLEHCDDFSTARHDATEAKPIQIGRYVAICQWAKKRYTVAGRLVIRTGDSPSPFTRIEQAAWAKYCA